MAPDVDEQTALVGRLRRWHRDREWGFIFSELHQGDVFLDGANAEEAPSLSEGDLVFFELRTDAEGHSAYNVRKASPEALQQALLAPVYQQCVSRGPTVPELPRSEVFGGPSSLGAPSRRAAAPRDAAPPVGAPQHEPTLAAVPLAQHQHRLGPMVRAAPVRSFAPPPPPPLHPAPTGPAFPSQGLAGASPLHQQPYLAPQGYNGYSGYGNDRGYAAMYPQGSPWPGGDAGVLSAVPAVGVGSVVPAAPQVHVVKLLLEPPTLLGRLNPQAIVNLLNGGARQERRGNTFRSSRNGTATQIGQQWCEDLRTVCAEVEQQRQQQQQQQEQQQQAVAALNSGASAGWGDSQQWMGWGATSASGHMDGMHGPGSTAWAT